MNWLINKLSEIRRKEMEKSVISAEIPTFPNEKSKPKKPRKPRVKKEKVVAPEKVEPKVDILKFEFDPANPRLGSIELDWNSEFVELLTSHGYIGNNEEEIVDKWLNDVCANIASNQYQGANVRPTTLAGANLIKRTPLGGGKTEIS
jgi:hypothetical protein